MLNAGDISAIVLSLKLAALTTVLTLTLGTPLAWWLSRGEDWPRRLIGAMGAMPLVLPPTVLGFYLLVFSGPRGPLGSLCQFLGLPPLPFSFAGLVMASVICSLPFVLQPLQNAFEALGEHPWEAAASLGAGPLDTFLTVIVPQSRPAFLTAAAMAFAHTLGEFGVVLMIGGNIPEVTRVLSMQLYVYVENAEYGRAHVLAASLAAFSIVTMLAVQLLKPQKSRGRAK